MASTECLIANGLCRIFRHGKADFETSIDHIKKIQNHYLISALLGDHDACSFLPEQYEFYNLYGQNPDVTLQTYNSFYPMHAFTLQMNLLARPDDIDLQKAIARFYRNGHKIGNYGHIASINNDREEAHKTLAGELSD